MATAIFVFHKQFRESIRGGKADLGVLTSILSSLGHLDPFRVANSGELGFASISEILNSGYSEAERYQMASIVVELLEKEVDSYPRSILFMVGSLRSWISCCWARSSMVGATALSRVSSPPDLTVWPGVGSIRTEESTVPHIDFTPNPSSTIPLFGSQGLPQIHVRLVLLGDGRYFEQRS